MKPAPFLNPLSISCIYAALAITWILFSDTVLRSLGLSPESTYHLSMIKGIAFVATTSLLLYLLVRKTLLQRQEDRAEYIKELRESEERFSTAFNSSPDGMAISSLESGRYIEVNSAFLSQLGYERSEVIGRTNLELGIWKDQNQRQELIDELLKGHTIHGVNAMMRRKDGASVEIEISVQKIHLGRSPFLLVIGRDLSVQRRLERQFLHAQKMEALGQLAAGIAHDFKNLLMLIRGFTELLDVTQTKNIEYRDQVMAAVDKADTLTRQLLAYSRRQEVTPEIVDLNHVVSGIVRVLPQMMPKNIRVAGKLDPQLWPISADRGQLEQVLMNLAVNAQDAMPKGGSFVITTANRTLENGFLGPDGLQVPPADYVELVAEDTGSGIAPELLGKIFEPFFTTKEHGKGTGLGLAAVYGIVKQSHGFTFVQSSPGAGTAFRIFLPRMS